MKQQAYRITRNGPVAKGIYRMVLEGDTSAITAPGQFVNIRLEGLFLRRPISICDWDERSITILYKVVGHGTTLMSKLPLDTELDMLTGLGNGFQPINQESGTRNCLLVGGGIGLAPLYGLAKRTGRCIVVIGAQTKDDLFYVDEFRELGHDVVIATDDGSCGIKGFVTDAIAGLQITGKSQVRPEVLEGSPEAVSYFYACGPMPMMAALCKALPDLDGQLSLEERMGCGFGACMGCCVKVKGEDGKCESKRVCKDGPIFRKEDVIW